MNKAIEALDDLVWDPTLCPDELRKRVYAVLYQKVLVMLNPQFSLARIKDWARGNEDVHIEKRAHVSRIMSCTRYSHCDMNEKLRMHYARIEQNYSVIRRATSALLGP